MLLPVWGFISVCPSADCFYFRAQLEIPRGNHFCPPSKCSFTNCRFLCIPLPWSLYFSSIIKSQRSLPTKIKSQQLWNRPTRMYILVTPVIPSMTFRKKKVILVSFCCYNKNTLIKNNTREERIYLTSLLFQVTVLGYHLCWLFFVNLTYPRGGGISWENASRRLACDQTNWVFS